MDLFGKLNEIVIPTDYTEQESATANININNILNTIEVNVKKVPNSLTINIAGGINPIQYDGSRPQEINIVSDESFTGLESRVTINENNIEDLKNTTQTLTQTVTTQGEVLTSLSSEVETLDNRINAQDNIIQTKQNKLTEGTNISIVDDTINCTYRVDVDSQLSNVSENPVQNKVIYSALATKQNILTIDSALSENSENPVQNKAIYSAVSSIENDVRDIQDIIPSEASAQNPLADKSFVNSSIATNTANFIGTFENITELKNTTQTITNNDYAFVINSTLENDFATITELQEWTQISTNKETLTNFDYAYVTNAEDSLKYDLYRYNKIDDIWELRASNINKGDIPLITAYNRYKSVINSSSNVISWLFEYTLNNSSFTAVQWEAINSGITANKVATITDLENNKADKINTVSNIYLDSNNKKIVKTINNITNDVVNFKAGSNINLDIDTNNNLTISAVDTTYSNLPAESGGTGVSLVTTGEKYIWNNKQSTLPITGDATRPIYISAAGTVSATNIYAGGTAVTLNGVNKSSNTVNFYAPVNAITEESAKRYLLGSFSTTDIEAVNTNANVYTQAGKLYSNNSEVINLSDTQALTNKTYNGYTLNTACEKTFTDTITQGSDALITSGAVYSAIGDIDTLLQSLNDGTGV